MITSLLESRYFGDGRTDLFRILRFKEKFIKGSRQARSGRPQGDHLDLSPHGLHSVASLCFSIKVTLTRAVACFRPPHRAPGSPFLAM